jgi:hypothetical protein
MEGARLIVRMARSEMTELREKTTVAGYRSMSDTVRAAIAAFQPKRTDVSGDASGNVCELPSVADLTVSYDE